MTQIPSSDEQTIAQQELEQYINQQALLVSVEKDASYSCHTSAKNFLPSNEPNCTITDEATATPNPKRETIKHTLIGSSKAVTSTIQYLHQLGYAQVGDWSPLLPSVNPGEVMSILSKQILVQ